VIALLPDSIGILTRIMYRIVTPPEMRR